MRLVAKHLGVGEENGSPAHRFEIFFSPKLNNGVTSFQMFVPDTGQSEGVVVSAMKTATVTRANAELANAGQAANMNVSDVMGGAM